MARKGRARYTTGEIVDETRINTDAGLVRITNSHFGMGVYGVKVTSEDGITIEEVGEMTRKRAGIVYGEKCEDYENGEERISSFIDLEEGLPSDLLGFTEDY